jgi:hypothetical protein
MCRVRAHLERERARTLTQDPKKLFHLQAIRANARPRGIAFDNVDPVFISLASKAHSRVTKKGGTSPAYFNADSGKKAGSGKSRRQRTETKLAANSGSPESLRMRRISY